MIVSIISAFGNDRQIGKDNKLLWQIPEDLKIFKEKTMHKTIVMGRKTYDSIGFPLQYRTTIVLSRDPNFRPVGCHIAASVQEALNLAMDCTELVVCGGEAVYGAFLPHASKLYLSHVDFDGPADAFFPEFNKEDWIEQTKTAYDRFVFTELHKKHSV